MLGIPYPLFAAVRIAVICYVIALLMLFFLQRRYIYYPARAPLADLVRQAESIQAEPWRNAEGEVIGWRIPPEEDAPDMPRPALLVFHGNAGMALDRTYLADVFLGATESSDWDVLLVEYPGYGARPGTPSEAAILAAAEEAFALAGLQHERIFLLGESLGTGVACHLAAAHPDRVAGVALITPFTRLADVGAHHYPIFPVRLLMRERYDNLAALAAYRGPVAFLLAERDEVVPTRLGQQLHDAYTGPKRLWILPGRHNTLDYTPGQPLWREVAAFISSSATP